jgi:hypothetical protein
MYRYADIRQVHLEITSRCNASCPQCARNIHGGRVNPNLPLTELSLSTIRKIFSREFIQQLSIINVCGNYGDPMVAQDTLEVFRYFRRSNADITLKMHTNGSGRTPEWWNQLAQVVDSCCFSIDGLEDTNQIYRRGTQWNLIMRSVESFIEAGGKAEWQFLVFEHNEHQIQEARALKARLGFTKFFVKKTGRFGLAPSVGAESRIEDNNGRIGSLVMAKNLENQNAVLVSLSRSAKTQGDYERYLGATQISCKAIRKTEIYITAEALVFPCCWTASLYPWSEPPGSTQIWSHIRQLPGGRDSIDSTLHSLEDIIEGPFFHTMIPEAWSPGPGRLTVCAKHCGEYDVDRSQFAQ